MSYEINVSLNGSHYFATAKRSLNTAAATTKMALDFKQRFPAKEGFKISVSYNPQVEYGISFDSTATDKDIADAIDGLSDK